MKHTNRLVIAIMIMVGLTLTALAIGALVSESKGAEQPRQVMPAIAYDQHISIFTQKEGCGVNTDVWSVAISFRLLLEGTMTPDAFKRHVSDYYAESNNSPKAMAVVDEITDTLLENCYGPTNKI